LNATQLRSVDYWGDIPENWQFIPIKYGFNLIGSGTTPPTGQEEYFGGSVPWVTTSELRENFITSTTQTVSELAIAEFSALKIFPENTVLIAMYGATIGRVAILGIPACVNQAVCALAQPICFEPRYVSYTLQASRDYLLSLASGGGQPNLNAEKIKSHYIPCPSLSKQRAIANYLDRETAKIDTLISAKERLLDLLTEKRQSLITHVVTSGLNPDVPMRDSGIEWIGNIPQHWEVELAKWLFQEIDERSTTGEEELLTVSHLTGVTLRSEKDVNMFMAETMEGYKICQSGDLVINTLWAWMGAMGVSLQSGIVSPAYHVYRSCGELHPLYIDLLVRISIFAQEVTRYSKGVWSSRLRLYPEEFFKVFLPVPPLREQEEIATYLVEEVNKLDNLTVAAKHTIELLQERRTALITAAVTGQIKVTA